MRFMLLYERGASFQTSDGSLFSESIDGYPIVLADSTEAALELARRLLRRAEPPEAAKGGQVQMPAARLGTEVSTSRRGEHRAASDPRPPTPCESLLP